MLILANRSLNEFRLRVYSGINGLKRDKMGTKGQKSPKKVRLHVLFFGCDLENTKSQGIGI